MRIFGKVVDKYDKHDKMHLYGYNVKFDDDFLRAWFKKLGDDYYGSWFWVPAKCVIVFAAEYLTEERNTMGKFRQGDVALKLGIDYNESELHDAMYDVRICRDIYYKVTGE
jgi:DNA polymerase-3 subunit epsilon